MPNLAQLVTELQKPAYAARVAAGANGELVTEVNAANPFSKRWRPVAVDEFKAIVAGKLGALSSQQREVLRILLQGDSVDLEDSDIRAALEGIFTDAAVRTALAAVAREDDLVTLNQVREAVRQIPAALVNQ
ncbi:hypothetical protein LCGC14_1596950 [marine sediment metagenome]|uniref:Uncharacterized protein n=1 Tax=marine sediment metagenome TaxID=412755 RepID=A0A0F9ICP6_9ZZZZ